MAVPVKRGFTIAALVLGALCLAACDDDGTTDGVDGGADAGQTDGGLDAGSMDGGDADGGDGDGGDVDGGDQDGGEQDGGEQDGGEQDAGDDDAGATAEYEAKLLIEHNAADDDTGFQVFFDWDPWASLTVTGPPDNQVLEVAALGTLADLGLTEMFLETNEPAATEVPRADVLSRLPEGEYTFEATSVEGDALTVTATLTHDIPAAVEILAPAEGAEADPEQTLEIRWTEVSETLEGGSADIAAYEVIVGRGLELPTGAGFFSLTYDVTLPAGATSIAVPAEYLRPGTPYEIEVLALEVSGNQTIAASTFTTSGDPVDDLTEVPEPGPTQLAASKFLIEHNATDEDTGYQLFLDGEPWSAADVVGPAESLLAVDPLRALTTFGLTEMFLETNEPEAVETPLEDVLALFPEGTYDFLADSVEGGDVMTGEATLTHVIPEATTLTSPAEDSEVDPNIPLQVSWTDVSTSLDGSAIELVAYQITVVKEEEVPPSAGFFEPSFSVHVPADTTSVTVPAEFLEAGSDYEIEVLALEASGNQTIALTTFTTSEPVGP